MRYTFLLLGLSVSCASTGSAADYFWTNNVNGNWDNAANWSSSDGVGFPNASGDRVLLNGAVPKAITLGQDITISQLLFNSNDYILQGTDTLTFAGTPPGTPAININGMGHKITCPIVGSLIAITGGIGTDLELSGDITSDRLKNNAGTIYITGGATVKVNILEAINGLYLFNKSNPVDAITVLSRGTLSTLAPNQFRDYCTLSLLNGTFYMNGHDQTIGTLSFFDNTFTGGVLVQEGGILSLASSVTALRMTNNIITGDINITNGGSVIFSNTHNGIAEIQGNLDLGSSLAAINFSIANGTETIDMNVSGIISGTGAGITKTGLGTLAFTGNSENTYAGLTTVLAGTLQLGKLNGPAIQGDILINGGSLVLDANDQISNTSTITLNSGTFNAGTYNSTLGTFNYYGGSFLPIVGAGTLSLTSAGTALSMRNTTLSANAIITNGGDIVFDNTNNGTAEIQGTIDLGGTDVNFVIANGTSEIDMWVSGAISNGGVVKQGDGTLFFIGNNTYSDGTLVSAGILIGDTSSLQGDIENNATLIFDQASGGIYNGDIIGIGNLAKLGTGELTFIGNNSYSGGTLVNAGTLIGDTSSLQGDIENNATLIFDQAFGGIYNGDINGIGNLAKLGTGELTLIGNNSYSGGTLVSAGTLIGDTFSLQGDIENNATLIFDQASDGTYGAKLSGSGNFEKQGTGALTLTGANTYSGGTLISAGTLIGNTFSFQGDIENNATLNFDQALNGTYSGNISGTGDFIKRGIGNLILSNNISQAGTATVANGTLIVNGSFGGGGSMIVSPGTTLKGIGTISKNITLYGTLAPGNSIGTINLVGDQVFASGSTLEIEFNASQGDLVNITGSLDIQTGAILRLFPEMGNYPNNFTYNFIETTEGVTGTFSTVIGSLPAYQFDVNYGLNDVALVVTTLPFSSLVDNQNALTVANCLDQVPLADNDINFVIANLRMLPTVELIKKALLQMQPSTFTSLAVVQENATNYVKHAIYHHLEVEDHSCYCFGNSRATLWASPYIARSSQDTKCQEPGFSSDTGGIIAGADFQLQSCSSIGLGIGYNHSDLDWCHKRGHADIKSTYVSLYGKLKGACGYIISSLMGSYNKYVTNRKINFASIDRYAKGNHSGMEGSVHLKGVLNYECFQTKIAPFVSFDYIHVHEKAFKEKDADSLNLNISSRNANLLIAEAGVNFSRCYVSNACNLNSFLELGVIQESRFNGREIHASFQDGCAFKVKGLYPSRTLAGIAAGFNTQIGAKTISFYYQGKYGSGFRDSAFYIQLQRQF